MIVGDIVIARLASGETYARVVVAGRSHICIDIAGTRQLVGLGRVRLAPKAVQP